MKLFYTLTLAFVCQFLIGQGTNIVDWQYYDVQNNTSVQTFTDVDGTGVNMTVKLSHTMQQVNRPVQNPFKGYLGLGNVLRIWKTSSPSVVTVTVSFSEPIELHEFGFGGIRCYSGNCDRGVFTWYDGPNGIGNPTTPSDPMSIDNVNYNVLEALDPAMTCTEMDGNVEGGTTGNGNIAYSNGTYTVDGQTQTCGTDCGKVYYIFNYHGTQVQSLVWQATRLPSGTPSQYLGGLKFSKITVPLELINFHAEKMEKGINLSWKTAQEIGVEKFEIQRKLQLEKNFTTIGEMDAKGNIQSVDYKYYDNISYNGIVQYRLKIIDFDGAVQWSEVESVKSQVATDRLKVWPNPVTTDLSINSPFPISEIRFYNIMGSLVTKSPGNNQESIKISTIHLDPGSYIVSVISGTQEMHKKILVYR